MEIILCPMGCLEGNIESTICAVRVSSVSIHSCRALLPEGMIQLR